jgi:hypothetical protein
MYDPRPRQLPNTIDDEMQLLMLYMITTSCTVYLKPQCLSCFVSVIAETRGEWLHDWDDNHETPTTEEDTNIFLRDWTNHVKTLCEKGLEMPCSRENEK